MLQQKELDDFSPQENFLDQVNNCPICGSQLKFEYRTEAYDNKLTEKAKCQECQIRIRDQHFDVH